jgi:hypothetical protein
MIRMFVRHEVTDFGAWREAYDAFDSARQQMGVKGQKAFQSAENPNDVTAWHDFDSLEAARAFVGSDELKEAMGAAGVSSEPTIWFTQEA